MQVILEYAELAAYSFGQKQLVMSVHLYVDGSGHLFVSKGNVQVHPSIQSKGLLVVGSRHPICLLEILFLESGDGNHFLEE